MQDNLNPHKIRIVQHNCRKSTIIMDTLLNSIYDSCDIVLIQEPWIGTRPHDNSFFATTHPSFTTIIPDTPHKPRVITIFNKHNPHLRVYENTTLDQDEDVQIVEVSSPSIDTISIFNIYNEK